MRAAVLLAACAAGCYPVDTTVPPDAAMHNLMVLNAYRASDGVGALALDDQLDTFATAAATDLQMGGASHAYFDAAGQAKFSEGFCGVALEVQTPSWPTQTVDQSIEDILAAMWGEGAGGAHHDALASSTATRLGVGLVLVDGNLWFTNDLSGPCP